MDMTGLEPDQIVALTQEFALNLSLQHPNVIKAFNQFGEHDADGEYYYYVVMEKADTNLEQLIKKWNQSTDWQKNNLKQILDCCMQIANGLQYIHKKNIIHRDIKPANILVFVFSDRVSFKISDFGTAKQIKVVASTWVGTKNYMAPELFSQQMNYGFPADIWSLGCLFVEVATGHMAFKNISYPDEDIKKGSYRKDLLCHDCVKAIIEKMIVIDKNNRITAQQVIEIIDTQLQKMKNVQLQPVKLNSSECSTAPSGPTTQIIISSSLDQKVEKTEIEKLDNTPVFKSINNANLKENSAIEKNNSSLKCKKIVLLSSLGIIGLILLGFVGYIIYRFIPSSSETNCIPQSQIYYNCNCSGNLQVVNINSISQFNGSYYFANQSNYNTSNISINLAIFQNYSNSFGLFAGSGTITNILIYGIGSLNFTGSEFAVLICSDTITSVSCVCIYLTQVNTSQGAGFCCVASAISNNQSIQNCYFSLNFSTTSCGQITLLYQYIQNNVSLSIYNMTLVGQIYTTQAGSSLTIRYCYNGSTSTFYNVTEYITNLSMLQQSSYLFQSVTNSNITINNTFIQFGTNNSVNSSVILAINGNAPFGGNYSNSNISFIKSQVYTQANFTSTSNNFYNASGTIIGNISGGSVVLCNSSIGGNIASPNSTYQFLHSGVFGSINTSLNVTSTNLSFYLSIVCGFNSGIFGVIFGNNLGSITNCYFKNNITICTFAYGSYCIGVLGNIQSTSNINTINNSFQDNISSLTSINCSGIFGNITNATVNISFNIFSNIYISCNYLTGNQIVCVGIFGEVLSSQQILYNQSLFSNIQMSGNQTNGIFGNLCSSVSSAISNINVTGSFSIQTGVYYFGVLAGQIGYLITISNAILQSINYSAVAMAFAGGIIGYANIGSSVYKQQLININIGISVTLSTLMDFGGIVGRVENTVFSIANASILAWIVATGQQSSFVVGQNYNSAQTTIANSTIFGNFTAQNTSQGVFIGVNQQASNATVINSTVSITTLSGAQAANFAAIVYDPWVGYNANGPCNVTATNVSTSGISSCVILNTGYLVKSSVTGCT